MAKERLIPARGVAAGAHLQAVRPDAPWTWLGAGWRDPGRCHGSASPGPTDAGRSELPGRDTRLSRGGAQRGFMRFRGRAPSPQPETRSRITT